MTTQIKKTRAKGLAFVPWLSTGENSAIAPELSFVSQNGDFIISGKLGGEHLFPELINQFELDRAPQKSTTPRLNLHDAFSSLTHKVLKDVETVPDLEGFSGFYQSFKACISDLADIEFKDIEFSMRLGKGTAAMFALETQYLTIQIYFQKTNIPAVKGSGKKATSETKILLFAMPNEAVELRDIMPLVEPSLLPEFSLDACFVCASSAMSANEVSRLLSLKPGGNSRELLTQLMTEPLVAHLAGKQLNQGVSIIANIQLADKRIPLYMPLQSIDNKAKSSKVDANTSSNEKADKTSKGIEESNTSKPSVNQATAAVISQPNSGKSQGITGRKLGPITLDGISLGFTGSQVEMHLDGCLSLSNVKLILNDLVLSIDIKKVMDGYLIAALGADLAGLDLYLKTGSFSLAGGLLRHKTSDIEGEEYVGQLALRTKTLSLSALGSYASLPNGQKSLFAYLAVNYPIGGIPAFFVEGLALGFGYNRGIALPDVKDVHQFPLVTALKGKGQNIGAKLDQQALTVLKQQSQALSRYLPTSLGQNMIAAGIKFNSFKLVDSVAVLMVEFGQRLAMHLVGTSSMRLPAVAANRRAIANIEMNYRVSLAPSEGVFKLESVLTNNSFIFSRRCKLTGGFAYYSWFDGQRAGDFVISMGGYHPEFIKPNHYPDVPRLGFRWQISDNLSMKGGMYAALTPAAIMAGGYVSASYKTDKVAAWFNTSLDFIMYWDPFYYQADFAIQLGAQATLCGWFFGGKTIRAELGAQLSIWGPEFAGRAKIKWWVFSFTIRFGEQSQADRGITWQQFSENYLHIPTESDFAELNVIKGERSVVTSEQQNTTWHIVDPDNFELLVNSPIPVNSTQLIGKNSEIVDQHKQVSFHLAPVEGKAEVDDWSLMIEYDGPAGSDFVAEPTKKNFPQAVWGNASKADIKAGATTIELMSGNRICCLVGILPNNNEAIDADEFSYQDVNEQDPHWQWGQRLNASYSVSATESLALITASIVTPEVSEQRQSIADFFTTDSKIDLAPMLDKHLDSAFIATPQIRIL